MSYFAAVTAAVSSAAITFPLLRQLLGVHRLVERILHSFVSVGLNSLAAPFFNRLLPFFRLRRCRSTLSPCGGGRHPSFVPPPDSSHAALEKDAYYSIHCSPALGRTGIKSNK